MDSGISDSKEQFFLATTALEDFWDISKPIVFLGDWCLRYSRKSFWSGLNSRILPSPWTARDRFKETIKYVDDFYEYLLPVMSDVLNSMHNEKLSLRSWRIIIGHWLNCCIYTLYDRYQAIRQALDKYPAITTIGLSKESFIAPIDTFDFLKLCKDDLYNLQLFSQILEYCGVDFPKKNFNKGSLTKKASRKAQVFRRLPKEMLIKLFRFSQGLFQEKSPIVLHDSFFPLPVVMKLFFSMKARVVDLSLPDRHNIRTCPIINRPDEGTFMQTAARSEDAGVPPSAGRQDERLEPQGAEMSSLATRDCRIGSSYVAPLMRSRLQNLFSPRNDFEKLFNLMLGELTPAVFIENYSCVKEDALKKFPKNTRAIFSAVSWSFHENFKVWAAHMSEKGTRLLGAQHGGNYGSEQYLFFEKHEVTITDRYYSWGWLRDDCRAKVIPAFANKLTGSRKLGVNNNEDSILLLTFALPRYPDRFDPRYYRFSEYFDYQFRFAAALGSDLRKKLRVRLFFDDFGWDCKERWNDAYPGVYLEDWRVKFDDSLRQSRICVNDNLSTTFLETLSHDKPTILFWDGNLFPLRQEAKPFYDELRSAGILFSTPEEAAEALRNIYGDVKSWWYEERRQKLTRKFRDRFGKSSPEAFRYWKEEFSSLLKELEFK